MALARVSCVMEYQYQASRFDLDSLVLIVEKCLHFPEETELCLPYNN